MSTKLGTYGLQAVEHVSPALMAALGRDET